MIRTPIERTAIAIGLLAAAALLVEAGTLDASRAPQDRPRPGGAHDVERRSEGRGAWLAKDIVRARPDRGPGAGRIAWSASTSSWRLRNAGLPDGLVGGMPSPRTESPTHPIAFTLPSGR